MAVDFSAFMKANKKEKANVMYPATKSLCDGDGNPLLWELKPITTKVSEKIREACMYEVPVTGKPGMFRQKTNSEKFQTMQVVAAVVFPDLNNKDLQNSYGVMSAEELIKEMIDDAGEYTDLLFKVQEISGFTTMQEDIEEAKN